MAPSSIYDPLSEQLNQRLIKCVGTSSAFQFLLLPSKKLMNHSSSLPFPLHIHPQGPLPIPKLSSSLAAFSFLQPKFASLSKSSPYSESHCFWQCVFFLRIFPLSIHSLAPVFSGLHTRKCVNLLKNKHNHLQLIFLHLTDGLRSHCFLSSRGEETVWAQELHCPMENLTRSTCKPWRRPEAKLGGTPDGTLIFVP